MANKRRLESTEAQEQIALVDFLIIRKILHYHIPNGGYRNAAEAAKFKRMGVSSGVPDICIPVKSSHLNKVALYIEMKSKTGTLTISQKWWHEKLTQEGSLVVTCYSAKEAIDVVEDYIYPF